MKSFFKRLIDKYWTKENISYVFWGALTTLVSILVYYAFIYTIPEMAAESANAIAIAVAILFAYITNKKFVFHTKCPDFKSLLREFWSFVSCRIITAVIEELLLSLLIRAANANEYLAKLIVCVVIFVLNYAMSKLFIFKKHED